MSMTTTRLRTLLETFRTQHRIPAAGVAIVTADGDGEIDVIGERVRGGGDPVRPRDAWHLGSCGKSITAVLYARLVERGAAAWGVPLSALFADLGDVLDPGWRRIAIDDLFVSQAGVPANLTPAQMRAAWQDPRPLPEQRSETAARVLATPPHRPGRFLYSNLGYILVGAAIERVTGMPYEAALCTHVLEPLGTTSAGFGPPPLLWGHEGRALTLGPVAVDRGRGAPADPDEVQSDNPAVMTPAGRLHLALGDWATFHRLFLTDGGGFLRPESIDRLLTPAAGRGRRQALGWAPVRGRPGAVLGQQGSNRNWVATAIMDRARGSTAMVVCNDGRPRLLRASAQLALRLLSEG